MADTPASPDPSESEDEVLTSGQHPISALTGNTCASSTHTKPPPTVTHPPPFNKSKLDDLYIKGRNILSGHKAYEHSKQRKDYKGRIKNSSTSASRDGISRPALQPAYPPPYNQFNHGYTATPQHPCYSEAAPPPPHRHWGSRGRFSGFQAHPSYTYPHAGYSQEVPHHSPHPSCSHSQQHDHEHAPHMDDNRNNTHFQQG